MTSCILEYMSKIEFTLFSDPRCYDSDKDPALLYLFDPDPRCYDSDKDPAWLYLFRSGSKML